MKKTNPNSPESPDFPPVDTVDLSKPSEVIERTVTARPRNPGRLDPVSHVFTIIPNVDTESRSVTRVKPLPR